jgi:putative DNA primase/helicase
MKSSLWSTKGVREVLYRMTDVLTALAQGTAIATVQSEEDADALWGIGVPATTNVYGAENTSGLGGELHACFQGADIVLVPNNDDSGFRYINDVGAALAGAAKRIRVLLLPGLSPNGGASDWLEAGGTVGEWWALVEAAPDWVPSAPSAGAVDEEAKAAAEAREKELIDELARVSPTEYDRRRTSAADELGVRRSTLDSATEARRAALEGERTSPPLFGHWAVEPWPEAVDGDALIRSIVCRVRSHVVLSADQALAGALWDMLAWVHQDAAVHSPILLVTSSEANSGKTRFANLNGFLVPRGLTTVGITGAVLYRIVQMYEPTIIVDEADVALVESEDLRAIINSGWTRGSGVPRCVGDNSVPTLFSTFAPKMLAMKGLRLPDTTLSRCIPIHLKRRKPTETVVRFKHVDDAELAGLRRQALRWANDNVEALKVATPQMPDGFDNRVGDNWHLLFAIADSTGGEWPEKARQAATAIAKVADTQSIGVKLLTDIKRIFEEQGKDRLSSGEIVTALAAMEERPWSEWKGGKPITANALARLLSAYLIFPTNIRVGDAVLKGYLLGHFEDAFERYL